MLRGHMKCCPSAVNLFLFKGHTISYLAMNVWYLVRNMWLPSRCTPHSPSAPYLPPPQSKIKCLSYPRISVCSPSPPSRSCYPLDSETGWTGEFWLMTNLLKKQK